MKAIPLGKPRRRWEDNIEVEFRGMWWGHGLDCSRSVQRQVAGGCESCDEPSDSI